MENLINHQMNEWIYWLLLWMRNKNKYCPLANVTTTWYFHFHLLLSRGFPIYRWQIVKADITMLLLKIPGLECYAGLWCFLFLHQACLRLRYLLPIFRHPCVHSQSNTPISLRSNILNTPSWKKINKGIKEFYSNVNEWMNDWLIDWLIKCWHINRCSKLPENFSWNLLASLSQESTFVEHVSPVG